MTNETDLTFTPDPEPVSADAATFSPYWSRTTKIIVTVAVLLAIVWLAQRFRGIIYLVVIAAILAYLFNPVIVFINKRTRLARGWVILLLYALLATAVIGGLVALGFVAYGQAETLIANVPAIIAQIGDSVELIVTQPAEPIRIGPWEFVPIQFVDLQTLPWESITNELISMAQPTVTTGTQVLGTLAASTARILGNVFFVFIISIYIAYEIPQLGKYLSRLAQQPGYSYDAERLARETIRIWNAYLRGQVILAFVIFFVVWIGLSIIGVRNALLLGIIAGLLEFIPNVGPIISAAVAMIVAVFQGGNHWGIAGWQLALVVLGFMFVVQQVENNLLVPRIVGRALDLNPLLVIIGVFMGASLAGILGAVLAAPVLATLKLLGGYGWRKMFDLDPFPKPEPEPPAPKTLAERGRALLSRFTK